MRSEELASLKTNAPTLLAACLALAGRIPSDGSDGACTTSYLMAAADERPGTYDVTVAVDGYQPWAVAGVEVLAGECHVLTQHLTALLEPI
jgi:hypothetical protein